MMSPWRTRWSLAQGADPTRRARGIVLLVNGAFLALVGGVQSVLELLGHYAGTGPYGHIFADSPYTLGWFEAHGLAALIGVLFITVASRDGRRFWHVFALAVHVLLGGANLMFWSSFAVFDVVPAGVVATVAHVLLVGAHAVCLVISRGAKPTA
jgi:hypothetical protein